MKILITGGAGYIGSHVVKALGQQQNYDITVYDNLSTGHKEAVTFGNLVVGDLADTPKLEALFSTEKFQAVLHFAGSIKVPESVKNPSKYYKNNTENSLSLLTLCQKYFVKNFIFSSTAAVYGIPENGVCDEATPVAPINPYGRSKLMTEMMIRDMAQVSDFRFVILRYFNVAGADPDNMIGQSFPEPFHLINVACEAALGTRRQVEIFGTDYSTPDGTCVRDYVHVTDVADAHVRSLEYLLRGGDSETLNCGYGHGYSVKEIIQKVKEVTNGSFQVSESGRRLGDPPMLIANAGRIQKIINWKPKLNNLEAIIRTAFSWEEKKHY